MSLEETILPRFGPGLENTPRQHAALRRDGRSEINMVFMALIKHHYRAYLLLPRFVLQVVFFAVLPLVCRVQTRGLGSMYNIQCLWMAKRRGLRVITNGVREMRPLCAVNGKRRHESR